MFAGYFHKNVNFCIENSIFPSDLKVVDVTQAFKKKSKTSKDNYRPIGILPNISKIYVRSLYNQMQIYVEISYLNINVDFAKDLTHNTA